MSSKPGEGAEIISIERKDAKDGSYYRVTGSHGNRRVAYDIPTNVVEKMKRSDAEATFKRGIHGTAERERRGE
jgi:hypothetical protein